MYWVAGLVGVCMIVAWPLVRESELFGLHVSRQQCSNKFARNAILLSSGLCDRGTHELEMQDLVRCSAARTEIAWGMTACVVSTRLADSPIGAMFASWAGIGVLVLLLAVSIRSFFGYCADVKKHAQTLEAQQQLLQQHQHQLALMQKWDSPRIQNANHWGQHQQQQQQWYREQEERQQHYRYY